MKATIPLVGMCFAVLAVSAIQTEAAVVTFANNPSNNSGDWTTFVAGLGATINTNVNFNTHPVGALQNNFYTASDGVTFQTSGLFSGVFNTAGPNDGNTSGSQPGEGSHAVSNTLVTGPFTPGGGYQPGVNTTLTITFAQPVLGAGLFTVDYFDNSTTMFLQAYDGPNATGNLLGTATAVSQNFQPNHLYFIRVADSGNAIESVRLIHNGAATGDRIGIDNIRFAVSTVPEPATLTIWSLLTGVGAIVGWRRRKRAAE